MKKIIGVACLFLFAASGLAVAQSVFEDARVLARYVRDGRVDPESVETDGAKLPAIRDSIHTIVTKYKLTAASISNNPFLKSIDFGGSVQASGDRKLIKSALSAAGGLDVTNIANAVADIMIEHAKQELTVAFFDRFKKFADANPEFGILFPKTTHNLSNLLSYKYPEMLPALRSGFLEDLRQLTFRLDDVLDLPRYQELFKNLPEVPIAIRCLRLVHELETGASNPADIIKEFAALKEWNHGRVKNVGSIMKISSFISESIRSSKSEEVWVSGKELKKLFYGENDTLALVYLGLLYQKADIDKIAYIKADGTVVPFTAMLNEHQSDILTFRNKLSEFVDLAERANGAYKDINHKLKAGETLTNEDYFSYINTSLDVVEYGFSLAELFGEDQQKAQAYLSILRQCNDLFRNIYTKEYNQAITLTLDILGKIGELANKNVAPKMVDGKGLAAGSTPRIQLKEGLEVVKTNNVFELKKGGATVRTFESLDRTVVEGNDAFYITDKTDKNPLEALLSFVSEIRPYAMFIANIVEAETEEDIKNAIDNAILPVGSSSIKKFSISNISVQSYLGARVNIKNWASGKTTWNNTMGVTAPIGVAFSWGGKGNLTKNPGAFTLFIPLVDLGAIVDYKLTTDDSGDEVQDYKVELGQIFAPGIYAVWGLPYKIPLSLGLGTQYGPGLLKGNNGIEAVDPDWSIRAFLCVDIPFFTLHNKPRNNLPKK